MFILFLNVIWSSVLSRIFDLKLLLRNKVETNIILKRIKKYKIFFENLNKKIEKKILKTTVKAIAVLSPVYKIIIDSRNMKVIIII